MANKNRELFNEFTSVKTPIENMRLFSDNNENKLEELNIRVPYLRNKISSITPGSKTFIYNTDDSLEVINRLSETKVHEMFNICISSISIYH